MASKRILIIGGTGAQGQAVIHALRNASDAFTIRVLTRNPEHDRARKLEEAGVEIVKGSFTDTDSVERALQDCYGIFVNTDGSTVKPSDELWAAIRIFEVSKTMPMLRHFVWSGLAYHLKVMNYDPKYGTSHINAKGRFGEFLQNQPSLADDGLAWTILNSCLYMEGLLSGGLISPTIHEDGTCEFAFPLPQGHIAFIALADLAAFALLIFQDRPRYSGKTLEAASCFATGAEIANTTSRVAGVQASFRAVGFDEWTCRYPRTQLPVAATDPEGPRNADSWVMFFNAFADDVWVPLKDLGLLKELHPGLRSLEMWMRENAYDGSGMTVLKSAFDR